MILLDKKKRLTSNFALSKKQLNGVFCFAPIGPNGDGTTWTKVYYGPNGTNSLRWAKTTTDLAGRVIREEKPGFGDTTLTNSYVYNSKGQLTTTTEPGMAPTLYEHDELGSVIKVCLDVNDNGQIDLSSNDRINESSTCFEQDGSSDWWIVNATMLYAVVDTNTVITNGISKIRLTGLSANKISETILEDIFSNQIITTVALDKENKQITTTFDVPDSTNDSASILVNGLQVSSETATGLEYVYSYDGLARQTGITDPRIGVITTTYNSKGQVSSVTDAATNITSFAYDNDTGRRVAITNALGKVARYEFDAEGQLVKQWGDTDYPVSYDYDDFNRMTSMSTYRGGTNWTSGTWPEGESGDATIWQYDEATGLLTNKLYADNNGVYYEYTTDGKMSKRIWARGDTTDYSYDSTAGQLTNINYSAADTTDITFSYRA